MRRTTASNLDPRCTHESDHKSPTQHGSGREPQVGLGILLSHAHETQLVSARWFLKVFTSSAWLRVRQTRIEHLVRCLYLQRTGLQARAGFRAVLRRTSLRSLFREVPSC